jgi:hypothetical protein
MGSPAEPIVAREGVRPRGLLPCQGGCRHSRPGPELPIVADRHPDDLCLLGDSALQACP